MSEGLLGDDLFPDDLSEDEPEESAVEPGEIWVSHFSVAGGAQWGHLVRIFEGQGWFEKTLDSRVSDPLGRFQVYVTENGIDAGVSVEWGDAGPVVMHRDFKPWMFGSPTLPAPHIARTSWHMPGPIWNTDERPGSWVPVTPEHW